MTNEEKLKIILNNPILYIENFMKIADKNGNVVQFKLNPQQRYLLENLEKYNVVLKSRQLGISSVITALSVFIACTRPNTTSLLLSYSIDSANGIFDKLKQIYYDMPDVLKPELINNNKKELKFTNGSKIVVATNGNKDVARGLTLNGIVHISEMAFMKETIEKNLLAIEQATATDGKIIVESTANSTNFFHDFWTKAEKKENMYKPFFFSWVNDKVMFAEEYEQFKQVWIDRYGKMLEVNDLDEEEMELYDLGATLEQLVWRRLKISNSSKQEFLQEFPHNPMVAFVVSGNNIFSTEKIIARSRNLDKALKRSQLKDLPKLLKRHIGKSLFIWEKPQRGKKYFIGADTSEGLKKDNSVIQVISEENIQVAEFASNTIKPYQFAEVLDLLGRYYNYGYVVVEKASSGISVIEKLRYDYRYMNMHKHRLFDERGKKSNEIGFKTTNKSKTIIISDFREAFEENEVLINSNDLLDEMKTFVSDSSGKMGAVRGKKDDRVMAMAMAWHGKLAGRWYVNI